VQGRIGDQVIEGDHIAGHEFAGVIDALGPGSEGPAVGTRVAVEPSVNCGRCERCVTGHPNQCPHVVFYGTPPVQGAYTEYVCHPTHLLLPVGDDITDDEAAMFEPLGIGIHSARRARVGLADTVAVFGCGPIGLVTMQAARAAGASRVFATDLHACRLELAKKLGADEIRHATEKDAPSWIAGLTGGRGVDVAFDCAGEQDSIDDAMGSACIGGRVCLVGIPRVDRVWYEPHIARRRELDVFNIRRARFTIEASLAMVRARQVELRSMVTHTFPLEKIQDAFELVDAYGDGVVKAVVRVSGS
jgi:L-iditol 2-dehydrogenase